MAFKREKIGLIPVILVLLFAFPSLSAADQIYRVRKGDSLARVAKKFHVRIGDIKQANSLSSDELRPGMKLRIKTAANAKRKSRDVAHGSAPERSYVLVEAPLAAGQDAIGNSPSASPQNVPYKEAKAAESPLASKDAGSESPAGEKTPEAAPKTAIAKKPASKVLGDQYHVVRKGESLSSIAKKYSVSLKELKGLNGISGKKNKASRLVPGQRLLVEKGEESPEFYVVRKGDTLLKIARRFGKTPAELRELNGLASDTLKPGQKLVIEEPAEDAGTIEARTKTEAQAMMAEELRMLAESPVVKELTMKEKLVKLARAMLDIPYRFGGNTFYGIDCSAFVQKAFGLMNIHIPRTAREQFHVGEKVERENLDIGDLLFFRTYASFPSHVGIYLGENLFIHASSRGRKVMIDSLDTPFYVKRFIGAKRLLGEERE